MLVCFAELKDFGLYHSTASGPTKEFFQRFQCSSHPRSHHMEADAQVTQIWDIHYVLIEAGHFTVSTLGHRCTGGTQGIMSTTQCPGSGRVMTACHHKTRHGRNPIWTLIKFPKLGVKVIMVLQQSYEDDTELEQSMEWKYSTIHNLCKKINDFPN